MTYEYACEACGHQWEAEQSISDKPLKKCPQCSKAKAKRLVSGGTGFLLKGGGWYADGYGSPSRKSESTSSDSGGKSSGKAESGSGGKAESGSGGKTESGSGGKAEKKSSKKSDQPAA